MAKDDSIVKSFRTTEEQFNRANDIFKREGFSVSEVIRILLDATIRENRIPRGLSTREMEPALDSSQARDQYITDTLCMAGIVPEGQKGMTAEEKLLQLIFGGHSDSAAMSNGQIREWAGSWGLPDTLSVSTLAELHDCGLFPEDPWKGIYDADIRPMTNDGSGKEDAALKDALIIMECQNNLIDNLEQIKRKLQEGAVKYLMESDNLKGSVEAGSADDDEDDEEDEEEEE